MTVFLYYTEPLSDQEFEEISQINTARANSIKGRDHLPYSRPMEVPHCTLDYIRKRPVFGTLTEHHALTRDAGREARSRHV